MEDSVANLRILLEKIAEENNFSNYDVKINPISSGGANYTSQLYLATISNDIKELKLFAKVIIIGEKMHSQGLNHIFDIEPFVYTDLSKIYRQLEENHNVPSEHRLEFSKYYGQNSTLGQEALILEDLSAQGYSVYDRFKSVDWPYAFKAIEELAKLHALSFAFEQEQPEEFEKAQKVFVVIPSNNTNKQQAKDFFMGLIKTTLSVTEKERLDRLQDFLATLDFPHDFMEYQKPLRHTVLIHGDFRVSNLMHKLDDQEGLYHLKILDYQTMKPGSPVSDLLYFIFSGTDEKFRSKHYLPLIDHYYSELSLAMQRLGLEPDKIYSREDFDTELKMKLPYGLIVATCLLPIALVEEEDAPVIEKDKDLTSFKIDKIGKLLPERINGIINDYIRWKVI